MPFPRSSGLLLHPTSLHGSHGIGDLGEAAYRFIDFLQQSEQQFWQVLPLGPTGYGNSPYQCYSAMAGNPLLISLNELQQQGLLNDADLSEMPSFPDDRVDYDAVAATKMPLLRRAWESLQHHATPEQHQGFEDFCASRQDWLDDYAFFMALKDAHGGTAWNTWEPELVKRYPPTLEHWHQKLHGDIQFHKFLQYEFFQQWTRLKHYANERGIGIIGDIPIYVAHNSADVWANPTDYHLDLDTGEPLLMAGVPPDYFSATGQLWGNPIYNWEQMAQQNFHWWVRRFQVLLDYVDSIRIDHFRGFEAYWQVPRGETTAINGEWVEAPGAEFFTRLRDQLGSLPILAEDLGTITPEVEALRDQFEFPGMKILQFAFGGGADNPYLPFQYPRNCLVYTGTHDNNTTVGWFNELSQEEQQRVQDYLGCLSADGIHWDMIRQAFGSVADMAIIPVQDLLGLGSEARMNFPSTAEGNWSWRYGEGALTPEICDRLRHLTQLYGRAPRPQEH